MLEDMSLPFAHPKRLSQNVAGAFYTLGECGGSNCLACGTPESEAPSLLADVTGENSDSYFTKQPSTADEVVAACRALSSCCVGGFRYGGVDREIIGRLGNDPSLCDFVEDDRGALVGTVDADGNLHAAFAASVESAADAMRNSFVVSHQGHVVKWHFNWHPEHADLEAIRRNAAGEMKAPARSANRVAKVLGRLIR